MKCPYCCWRCEHAAAYEKPVQVVHHDILLFHRQVADPGSATSSMRTSFIQYETVNQRHPSAVGKFTEDWGNSDYEFDPAILGHDLRSEQARGGNIEDNSDSEDVS